MKAICLGDSFTRGFGVRRKDNWVSLLHVDKLSFINKGINGDTTSGMLSRLQKDVIDESPRYAIITGGINDFIVGSPVDTPKNNYMALVHQAYHNLVQPIIGIEAGFVPANVREDWATFTDFNIVLEKLCELREWLHAFSKAFGVPYIDFFDALEQAMANDPDTDFFVDGIHITEIGHEHMANAAIRTLNDIIH